MSHCVWAQRGALGGDYEGVAIPPDRTPMNPSLLVLFVLLLTACAEKSAASAPSEAPKSYSVLTLKPVATTLYIDVPATLTGKQNVEIRPMIDGYIAAIEVDEGAWVRAGQRLFEIKAPQYEQAIRTAEAGIKTAEADVSSARMSVDKVRPLVAKEIISEYELDAARFTLAAKEAALAQARVALVNARINLGYTHIDSPVDGVIGTLPFKIGSLVSSTMTDPLTTVSDIADVYAYFSVNEKVLLALTRDIDGSSFQQKLEKMPDVQLITADGARYDQPGRVQAASGLIDATTGSTNFRATFANPRSLLRSGASGTVRLPRPIEAALVVPQSAVYELQGKHLAYRVAGDDTVESVAIEVRATPDGKSYVVDHGLRAGDRVVLDSSASLKAGSVIAPCERGSRC